MNKKFLLSKIHVLGFVTILVSLVLSVVLLQGCGSSNSKSKTVFTQGETRVSYSADNVYFSTDGKYDVHITQKDSMERKELDQHGASPSSYGTTDLTFAPTEAGTATIKIWTTADSANNYVIKVKIDNDNETLTITDVNVTVEHR